MTNEIAAMTSALPLSATPKIKYSTLALLRAIVPKQKDLSGYGKKTHSFHATPECLERIAALESNAGFEMCTARMVDLSDEVFSQFEGVKIYHLTMPCVVYSTYYETCCVSYITLHDKPLFMLHHNVQRGSGKSTAFRAVFRNCSDMAIKDILDELNNDMVEYRAWLRDEKVKNERLLRDQRCDMIRLADTLLHAASVGS